MVPLTARLRPGGRTLWYIIMPSLWIGGTTIFINDNVLEVGFVTGGSMEPTLSPDDNTTGRKDALLWKKWQANTNVRRGDVMLFGLPSRPEDTGVKRVIGVEGDTVLLDPRRRPKHARKDGGATEEVPEARSWDAWMGRAKVPEGHVWVEGDNWRASRDSNWYGPISKSLITGKAVAVVLPSKKFGSRPWEGFHSRTKVVSGKLDKRTDLEALEALGTNDPI